MGDLWDDATARRLALVLQGGYPPEYWTATGVNNTGVGAPCPANVWRVIIYANVYCAGASALPMIAVYRAGAYLVVCAGSRFAVTFNSVSLNKAIVLRQGEYLYFSDGAAVGGNVTGTVLYVDVPIPHNDGLEARRIRRG